MRIDFRLQDGISGGPRRRSALMLSEASCPPAALAAALCRVSAARAPSPLPRNLSRASSAKRSLRTSAWIRSEERSARWRLRAVDHRLHRHEISLWKPSDQIGWDCASSKPSDSRHRHRSARARRVQDNRGLVLAAVPPMSLHVSFASWSRDVGENLPPAFTDARPRRRIVDWCF